MAEHHVDLNTQIRLAKRPSENYPSGPESLFQLITIRPIPIDEVPQGSVIVRNHIIQIQPSMRNWISGDKSQPHYVQLGQMMKSRAVGQVIYTKGKVPIGTLVFGYFGWQKYAIAQEKNLVVIPTNYGHPQDFLSVLGSGGLTAYIGLTKLGKIEKGQTVAISAIGSAGQIAIQLAKFKQCKVIAIVDSDDKIPYIKSLGAQRVINYKHKSFESQLKKLCPQGGYVLDAVLMSIKDKSRLLLAGVIKDFNQKQGYKLKNYPRLIIKKCLLSGFRFEDYKDDIPNAIEQLKKLLNSKSIVPYIEWYNGLDQCPNALKSLLNGNTKGSVLVKVNHNISISNTKL